MPRNNDEVDAAQTVHTINEIIAIEAAAQELIKSAERERAELPAKITEALEAYEAQVYKEALEKINEIRTAEETQAKEKITALIESHGKKMAKLKKITDENIDGWAEKIFSYIITPTQI